MDSKKKIVTISSLIAILVMVIGVSIAYFSATSTTQTRAVQTGNLSILFDDSTAIVNAENILPLSESSILSKATKKEFSITNTSDGIAYVDINLKDIETIGLKDYDVKWALYEGNTKITTGNFASLGEDTRVNLTNNVTYAANQKRDYKLYIWINDTQQDQSRLQNKSLSAKIEARASSKKSKTLSSLILGENNSNVLNGTYNFATDYTYDEPNDIYTANYQSGLYKQENDSSKSNFGFATYYYRGEVENNYVQFGTYKSDITNRIYDEIVGDDDGVNYYTETLMAHSGDPIIWRIVRINEDGSIKLIDENSIGMPERYNPSTIPAAKRSKYIQEDGTDSNIKGVMDTWYSTHIAVDESIDNKIQIGNFCNDNYDNAMERMPTYSEPSLTPVFTCSNDALNIVNEKVGLITADELVYSGVLRQYSMTNIQTYLNNRTAYWTITPASATSVYRWFPNNYYLHSNAATVTTSAGRAVINLKSDVTVSEGNGTKTNPYIIN